MVEEGIPAFGELLRRHRLATNLTQEDLAVRAGLSAPAITKLETGERQRPHPPTVRALATALGLAGEEHATFVRAAYAREPFVPAPTSLVAIGTSITSELPLPRPEGRPAGSHAHNLPAQLTSFVERAGEMVKVRQCLCESRLVTITGSGGSGKTRLALELSREVLDDYSDGVWLIELAPVTDPSLVPVTIATVLQVREIQGRPLLDTLIDYLRNRAVLLVVDNCEHVIDACARAIDTLLQACPGLRILATSRERLGVAGEATWRVPSLSTVESRTGRRARILYGRFARPRRDACLWTGRGSSRPRSR